VRCSGRVEGRVEGRVIQFGNLVDCFEIGGGFLIGFY